MLKPATFISLMRFMDSPLVLLGLLQLIMLRHMTLRALRLASNQFGTATMLTLEAVHALMLLVGDIVKVFKGDAQKTAIDALRAHLATQIEVDVQNEINALGK